MPEFPFHIPFVNQQGIELVSSGNGQSCLRMTLRPEQTNQLGMAHGGLLMTLLDVTMAQAARSIGPDRSLITIEMKTTFFQPALGRLTGQGQLLHATGSMAFTEAHVIDEQGRKCAHATATFRYLNLTRDPGALARLGDPSAGIQSPGPTQP
jgi:uncharacterized protein (TIGR00369 family)